MRTRVATLFNCARLCVTVLTLPLMAADDSARTRQRVDALVRLGQGNESIEQPRTAVGFATYYADSFEGQLTASGRRYHANELVAAHPTYPFDTIVRVTNVTNSRWVRVRIIDRGPAADVLAEGVIIDVSRRAAQALRIVTEGRARVRLAVVRWGNAQHAATTDRSVADVP